MKRKKKRTPSRAKRTKGFASKLEHTLWKSIKTHSLKRKGISVDYEAQHVPYTIRKTYVPDLRVGLPDGSVFYIEIKGWFRPEDRVKMLAVKRDNPLLDIRLVFDKDQPIRKGSRTRYSDWCVDNGFPYSVGSIPKEWFNNAVQTLV